MTTFLASDKIFATISQRGRIISNINLSGVTSIRDIISRFLGKVTGLVTIKLRNYTQGWQQNHIVML